MRTDDKYKINDSVSQNWGAVSLGDEKLFSIGTGGTPSTSQPQFWNGNIPWVTPTDLSNLGTAVISETARTITSEGVANSSAKPLPAGSIVLSTRAPIGYASILGQEMAINQGCKGILIKDSSRVSNEYLYFNLLTQTQKMKELGSGSTFRELSQHNLKSITVSLPDIQQQKKIVLVLNLIQDLVIQQKEMVAKNLELKAAMSDKLFALGTKGEKLKESNVGRIPESWTVIHLKDLLLESPKNGAFIKDPVWGEGVRFANVADIYKGSILNEKNLMKVKCNMSDVGKYSLNEGDVLFVRSSLKMEGIGQCAVVAENKEPLIYDCHIIRISLDKKSVDPLFLVYYFSSQKGKNDLIARSKTTTMTTMNQDGLIMSLLPLPNLQEQLEIVDILSTLDKQIALEQEKEHLYEEMFNMTLDKLMSGEIDVKDIEIN